MNRRLFLRNGAFAGLSISALTVACKEQPAATNGASAEAVDAFELNEATLEQLQQLMKEGKHTARSITQLYLDRIQAIDTSGPAINAVIEINPDALAIADAMDQERKAGNIRGPLHGIPVLVKDNIDTADTMMTTAGSLAMEGHRAAKDAFIIQKLREAGAVLMGKTNLSEWANFRSSRSTSGWSSRGGQTKNPCVLDRNPCGSSSGSGAAVAANLCAIAIGTETDGSVIAPSAYCGIVGIKPTVGLWSRTGIIPISSTQDTGGPMARTVKDAAILLGALAGSDPADPVTANSAGKAETDYTKYLDAGSLKGKRIGIEQSYLQGHEGVVAIYQSAIETLRQLGAEVVEIEFMKAFSDFGKAEFTVMQYEFKAGLNKYLSTARAKVKSLDDVIAFNKANAAKAMPWFKQETLESSNAKGSLAEKEYLDALAQTTGSRKIIDDILQSNRLDAVCGTSISPAGCTDLVSGDYYGQYYFCPPAAMAGYPHITVPMGHLHHLPLGLSFVAGAFEEGKLIGFAYAFEQATRKRVPPQFLPTIS